MTMTLPELRRDAACLPEPDDEGFGALRTEGGSCLPLVAMSYHTDVTGVTALTVVRQTFRNGADEPVETAYIYPLPARAAVKGFVATLGGRRIVGKLDERGAARATYDRAVASGHRAAIAEEERPEIFTTRVGNLQPGEVAVIELELASQLPLGNGQATLRLPLVVGARYVPGVPLDGASVGTGTAPDTDEVPDASRITPPVLLAGMPNPVRLDLTVTLDPAGLTVSDLRSSLHALAGGISGDGPVEGPVTVSLQPGERLDRDFILRWSIDSDKVSTSFAVAPDSEGDEGTFVAVVVPPAKASRIASRDRDVVVVVDESGSMGDHGEEWKIVVARRGAARIADSLGDADRIAAFAFDTGVRQLGVGAAAGHDFASTVVRGGGLVAATDRNRYRIVEDLAALKPRGGTEFVRALTAAFAAFGPAVEDRERCMVFVTDGQVANEAAVRQVVAANPGVRMFVVGIGRRLNFGMLQGLATMTGGHCELVESEDRLDAVMASMLRRISTPILRNVVITGPGIEILADTVTPDLADAFEGVPLVIRGRYRGEAKGTVALTGTDRGGQVVKLRAKVETTSNGAFGPVWARARLRDMEDDYDAHPMSVHRSELMKRIVATSLAHGVLCRFTAFVAVDEAAKVAVGSRTVTQPVDLGFGTKSIANLASTLGVPSYLEGTGDVLMGGGARTFAPSGGAMKGAGSFGGWDDFGGARKSAMPAPSSPLIPKGLGSVLGTGYAEQAKRLVERMGTELEFATAIGPDFRALVTEARNLRDEMVAHGAGDSATGKALLALLSNLAGVTDVAAARKVVEDVRIALGLGGVPRGPLNVNSGPLPPKVEGRGEFWK